MINSPKVTYDGKVWDAFVNKIADILQTFVNAGPCSTYFTVWFKFELYFFLKVQLTSCQQQIYSIASHQIICKQLPEQWWTNSLKHICISGISIWMQKSTCICTESKNKLNLNIQELLLIYTDYIYRWNIPYCICTILAYLCSCLLPKPQCAYYFWCHIPCTYGLLSDMYLHPFII